jgi:hypothetical protein
MSIVRNDSRCEELTGLVVEMKIRELVRERLLSYVAVIFLYVKMVEMRLLWPRNCFLLAWICHAVFMNATYEYRPAFLFSTFFSLALQIGAAASCKRSGTLRSLINIQSVSFSLTNSIFC